MNSARSRSASTANADHARHALARRRAEAQLRLHVVRPAVDGLGERDDGAPQRRPARAAGQQPGADDLCLRGTARPPPLGSALLALIEHQPASVEPVGPTLGPDAERLDERALGQRVVEDRLDEREIERLGRALRDAQQHADVRPLQVSSIDLASAKSAVSLLNWRSTTADVVSMSFSDRNWK